MTYDPYADPHVDRVKETRIVETAPPVHEPVVVDRRPVVVGPGPADTIKRIVWLAFGVLQVAIVLRIVLLLLGANEGNDLVAFIVGVTDPFVDPFRGMFNIDEVNAAGGSVFDVAAVVALIGWTLIEALVLGIIGLADRRTTTVA